MERFWTGDELREWVSADFFVGPELSRKKWTPDLAINFEKFIIQISGRQNSFRKKMKFKEK